MNLKYLHFTNLLYFAFNAHTIVATELHPSSTDNDVQSPQYQLEYKTASLYEDILIPKEAYPNSSQRRSKELIGTNNWPQVGESIERGTVGDVCGYAVDISNDGRSVIMGCPHDTVDGQTDVGSAHIYRLVSDEQGVEDDKWVRLNVNVTGLNGDDYSGYAVSFAQDTDIFAVADPLFRKSKGRVRVFRLSGTSSNPSIEQIGDDMKGENINSTFGASIDLSGDGKTIAIGADEKESGDGYVKVFSFNNTDWVESNSFSGALGSQERFGI